MKHIRVKEFIDALADYIQTQSSVPADSVFAHELIEDHEPAATTVLRNFGGNLSDTSAQVVTGVQIKSRANTQAASLARSELILAVFRDDRGLSIDNVELPVNGDRPAFKLMSISDLKPPTPLGRNPADKKYESVFNCVATYHVVTPTP